MNACLTARLTVHLAVIHAAIVRSGPTGESLRNSLLADIGLARLRPHQSLCGSLQTLATGESQLGITLFIKLAELFQACAIVGHIARTPSAEVMPTTG